MSENNLGNTLKSIRLEKNYSIEEVAKKTRIAERFLLALEANQRDLLPSPVQAKGYLRNLLAFYQIDNHAYLQAWDTDFIIREETETEHKTADEVKKHAKPETPSDLIQSSPINQSDPEIEPSPSSQEIFSGIGKKLASRRIQIGLTLADTEEFTHIKDHNLSFLEKGAFDQIPSPVQARGMLKIYAEFLELDQQTILHDYAEGLRKKRLEQIAQENLPEKKAPPIQLKKSNFLTGILTPDFLVVGTVVFVMLIAVVWGSSYVISLKKEADWQKIGVDRDIVMQGTPSETPQLTTTLVETQPVTVAPPVITTPLAENLEPTSDSPIQLNLSVQQRTWVRITIDDEIAFEGRLVPGNPYNYSAEEKLVILTGNGAALQVLFNNQYLGSLGKIGEMSEFIFTDAGVITPTPVVSPTIVVTQQPTLTLTPTSILPTATVTPFIP